MEVGAPLALLDVILHCTLHSFLLLYSHAAGGPVPALLRAHTFRACSFLAAAQNLCFVPSSALPSFILRALTRVDAVLGRIL